MKLRAKILLGAILYGVLITLGGFGLWRTSEQTAQDIDRIRFAKNVFSIVTARRGLLIEYLLSPNERIKAQWDMTTSTFDSLIQASVSRGPTHELLIAEIDQNRKVSDAVFQQLTTEENLEVKTNLVSRMLVASQTVISESKQFIDLGLQDLADAQKLLIQISTLFLGGLFVGIVLLFFFFNKNIIKPVQRLTAWTEELAHAQFIANSSADIKTRDEIGALASSFEHMATKLKESYEGLEQKVRARTTELAGAKAKDDAILLSLGDGLIATDKDGNIILVNPAFEKLLGWSQGDVQGKKLTDAIQMLDEKGENVVEEERTITKAIREKSTAITTTALQYKRKDGSVFPVAITVSPIMLEGNVVGAVEVFRDITRDKELEQMRNDFMNIAAHDLRTPSTAVKGFVSMIRKGDFGTPPTGEIGEALGDIEDATDRMITMVNDFLTVARIEQGRLKIEPKPLDIVDFLHDLVRQLAVTIGERPVELTVNVPNTLPNVLADREKLAQVLTNLVDNSLKHTEKGTVTVSAQVQDNNKAVEIVVADTGTGIDPEDLPHLFQRYYRGKQTEAVATGRGGGLGLGLHVVKTIVEMHGGTVWAESALGQGTKMYMTLPLA